MQMVALAEKSILRPAPHGKGQEEARRHQREVACRGEQAGPQGDTLINRHHTVPWVEFTEVSGLWACTESGGQESTHLSDRQ